MHALILLSGLFLFTSYSLTRAEIITPHLMYEDLSCKTTKGERLVTYRANGSSSLRILDFYFGMFDLDNQSVVQTNIIPYKTGQPYGWVAKVDSQESKVKIIEFLKLPSPGNWKKEDNASLSADKSMAKIVEELDIKDGFVSSFWSISPNDPTGDYTVKVFIGNAKPLTFDFTIKDLSKTNFPRLFLRRP